MLKVGITGGIGSGKSIVSKIIETLGFPVFNSDQVSKDLVNTDPEIKAGSIVRVLSSKNEMRITNLETKTVEKIVMVLASTEKALQRALQSGKDAENAIRDAHNSDLLALIGM